MADKKDKDNTSQFFPMWKKISIYVCSFIALYTAFIIFLSWPITEFSISKAGVFGDSFGVITSLFTGLAFAGLITTILLQREDIKIQQEDIELQREAIELQTKELKLTRDTMEKQNFESTFFQMLRLHNDIVNALTILRPKDGKEPFRGRECFGIYYSELKSKLNIENNERDEESTIFDTTGNVSRSFFRNKFNEIDEMEFINNYYSNFWNKRKSDLAHYYEFLINIVEYVDNNKSINQEFFINIIKAQLSDFELLMLFYYCSTHNKETFKSLVESYGLLKHLDTSLLFRKYHPRLFFPTAFGEIDQP